MKRPFLVLLALAATGGFGWWLVRTPNTQREILLACAGWVLGFWVAAAIQSRRPARRSDDDWQDAHDEADLDDDDEAGWEDGEDWDDEERG